MNGLIPQPTWAPRFIESIYPDTHFLKRFSVASWVHTRTSPGSRRLCVSLALDPDHISLSPCPSHPHGLCSLTVSQAISGSPCSSISHTRTDTPTTLFRCQIVGLLKVSPQFRWQHCLCAVFARSPSPSPQRGMIFFQLYAVFLVI